MRFGLSAYVKYDIRHYGMGIKNQEDTLRFALLHLSVYRTCFFGGTSVYNI